MFAHFCENDREETSDMIVKSHLATSSDCSDLFAYVGQIKEFSDETSPDEGPRCDGFKTICTSVEEDTIAFSVEGEASYVKVADDSSEGSALNGLDATNGIDNDGDDLDGENVDPDDEDDEPDVGFIG